jgi:hypothetical protein
VQDRSNIQTISANSFRLLSRRTKNEITALAVGCINSVFSKEIFQKNRISWAPDFLFIFFARLGARFEKSYFSKGLRNPIFPKNRISWALLGTRFEKSDFSKDLRNPIFPKRFLYCTSFVDVDGDGDYDVIVV